MADPPLKDRLDAVFDLNNARAEFHSEVLKSTDDPLAIVLKGHLVVEELLRAGVEAHCPNVEHVAKAKLRYPQLVHMLRALEKVSSASPPFWDAVLKLNRIRNELAHQIEPKGLKRLTKEFVGCLESNLSGHKFRKPHDSSEALRDALHFVIGGLEVVALWQEGVEQFVVEKLNA